MSKTLFKIILSKLLKELLSCPLHISLFSQSIEKLLWTKSQSMYPFEISSCWLKTFRIKMPTKILPFAIISTVSFVTIALHYIRYKLNQKR